MDHQQLEESVAAYALNALDDAGRAETERTLLEHLAGCASCRDLFNDLREVTADLALAVTPIQVRPEVERRILEGLPERAPRVAQPVAPRRSRFSRVGGFAAAAAIVALVAWNLQLVSRVNDTSRRTETVAAALSLLGSDDAHSTRLAGAGAGGTLVFVYRPGEAVLVGHDVSAPAKGKVLQLWLMRAGVPTSAGVFRPDNGLVALAIHVDPAGFDAVAVTEELGPRGAARPSGAPTYRGTLSA
jgi:anti-sigma-K factor RskA